MEVSRVEKLPPPPGIISSIKAGFDTIATHITAILLPLLLNLFLWLGPRLRLNALFDLVKGDAVQIWKAGGVPETDIQRVLTWYNETIPSVNLFWLLRTLPIGISSLLYPQKTSITPLGDPATLQVSALNLFGWLFLLTLIGWIGGGLYFRSVAWITIANKDDQRMSISHAVVQTILISIFWGILLMVVGVPVFLVLALALQLSPFIANLLVLVVSLASMWVIVPLFFWPHGVFIRQQNVITSIISSVQMARFTLPTSSMFVLTVFLLTFGLNYLWSIPPEDSWMTFVGIFGHSFVATALLAGSFIYYRDMNAWLQTVIDKLRPNSAIKK
ncbi:MAG: hypothetical protein HY864_10605 [Chloroflexi bacterium]|nr:hypothetical protein [Chloroflexota bacterium]